MTADSRARGAIEMVEVGPRDGLQNESDIVSTDHKIVLINKLLNAGFRRLEVASFVHPKRVPQMADAEAVVGGLPDLPDVIYIGLVLNKRGALRALDTKVHELGAVSIASDTFAQRNQGQTSEESLAIAKDIVRLAREHDRRGQITLSAAFGCPFEGAVKPQRLIDMAKSAAESLPVEVALADTIGVAVPHEVSYLVSAVREAIQPIPVRVHFHNTRNTGLANVWAAIEAGASVVDASVAGMGGCPFAPAATGNVPSEDVLYMLERSGIQTGVDLDKLIETAQWLSGIMGRTLPGMVSRAGGFPCIAQAS